MAVTGTTFARAGSTANTTELRALGAAINAALITAGMVQTADTGQVNWTTVNWAASTQTWGYEVWRFADTLQATKPIYVRLLYTQTASIAMLTISAQVGTGTDGAGNLTSQSGTGVSVSTAQSICVAGSSATTSTSSNWYIYGDGSSLVIAVHPDRWLASSLAYGGCLYVERARAIDGTPIGDGFLWTYVGAGNSTVNSQVIFQHTLYAQPPTTSGGWLPGNAPTASAVIGTDMYTYPWFTGFTPRFGAPSQILIGINRADLSVNNTFVCSHYGASRTFVVLSAGTAAYSFGMAGTVGYALGLRTT